MPGNIRVLYAGAWALVALIECINLIWARHIGFRIETHGVARSAKTFLALAVITGALCAASSIRFKTVIRKRFYSSLAHTFMWIALLAVFTHVCAILQYLCITTDFPLISHTLTSADSALGFHWLDAYQWVNAHPAVHATLNIAYQSGAYQMFVIPLVLAVTLHAQDYAELVMQFMLAVMVTLAIAVFLPAESAFVHFGVTDPGTASTVSDFARLRSGNPATLMIDSSQGLVSFPSLHTVLGLCFAYALRHVRVVFPATVVLNALMILATPTQGGHYLVDTLCGLVIAPLIICLVRRFFADAGPRSGPLTADPHEDPARPVPAAAVEVSAR